MNMLWLRSDLRAHDNPALVAAMSSGLVFAVCCQTQGQWDLHNISPAKRSLRLRQLETLAAEFKALNVPLIIVDCHDFSGIPKKLLEIALRYKVTEVFINDEYELNERHCTELTQTELSRSHINSTVYVDQCMIAPGQIRTKQGGMFKVFTAFKRAFLKEYSEKGRGMLVMPSPQAKEKTLPASDLSALKSEREWLSKQETFEEHWPAGEERVLQRLDDFLDGPVQDYATLRDYPALPNTSTLSPYLAIGALSTTQCMQAALSDQGSQPLEALINQKSGVSTWINELIWREFYRHILFAKPGLCKHQAFKSETDNLPWKQDKKLYEAWKAGQTGYPIVDAAMRQLADTGWMHNRLRMVVAMFFTKHLFLDWRLGEAYFMSMLVDGDFASNNGGWQWSASTGVDAAPYFRIFNPVRQSERFDGEGVFIKRYVPELASLSKNDIHMPTPHQAKALGYPVAIVDHNEATRQTKEHFKHLAQRAEKK